MEHLALEIFDLEGTGSKYATLEPDQSITITDTSEIFASGDVWSHSFQLNVHANAHIFGTAADLHGSRLHEQINKRRARLWVLGLPLYLGYLKLDDEAEVDADGNVDVSFESGQKTFDEMIEGAKANQVPLMNDIEIGMALWRKRWVKYRVKLKAMASVKVNGITVSLDGPVKHTVDGQETEYFEFTYDGEEEGNSVQEYPRMVFPHGIFKDEGNNQEIWNENCINTDYPYMEDENGTPTHPYCNVALCYQKYGYDKKDENGAIVPDYTSEPEAQRGYEYMPADRLNSAPNFYVIYWIRCLMKHLGIYVEENQMMDVEDLRRLFFVNTKCAYKEPKKLRTGPYDEKYGKYVDGERSAVTQRVERLVPEYFKPDLLTNKQIDIEKSGFAAKSYQSDWQFTDNNVIVKIRDVASFTSAGFLAYIKMNTYFHKAYATSECFPDADISDVISGIESAFGIRFLFSDDFQRVRIILLRNIFRSSEVQDVVCEITKEDVKTENSIRGFRMTYGNTEDTHYYYKGFADKLPHKKVLWVDNSDKHDYSHWNLNAEYSNIINKVSAFDKTCYVTPDTGDAYGIKIDKDAKRYDELHPSLFEFAGFMDAEDGDCTGDEETIEEINIGFTPAIMNDLNMEDERSGSKVQRFALFADDAMRPRRVDLEDGKDYNNPETVYDISKLYAENSPAAQMKDGGIVKPGEFAINSDMYAAWADAKATISGSRSGIYVTAPITAMDFEGHVNEGYRLYLQDNYEPNDDGVCPIENHDWGLTLGIMRGSGSDAYVNYEDDPDDDGNDTWYIEPGSSVTAHPDTCDNYGRQWDYDIEPSPAGRYSYAGALRAAGWNVEGADDEFVNFSTHIYISTAGGNIDFLCTPAKYQSTRAVDHHPVLTPQELETEINSLWDEYGWNLTEHDYDRFILSIRNTDGSTAYSEGRISLKLRAEKPNPYFDPTQPETHYDPEHPEADTNPRYLHIDSDGLQRRGLCDQFYKEYSYWVRNARIVKRTVHMELAQLLSINKTKKVRIGDITGFIRKMQYSISNQTGLGEVTMEIMYI